MASNILPRELSAGANGIGILVTASAAPGTLIHTAVNTAGQRDEVFLFVASSDTVNVNLQLQIGGTTQPLYLQIDPRGVGLVPLLPGFRVSGGIEIRAWSADGPSKVTVYGWINRIID